MTQQTLLCDYTEKYSSIVFIYSAIVLDSKEGDNTCNMRFVN